MDYCVFDALSRSDACDGSLVAKLGSDSLFQMAAADPEPTFAALLRGSAAHLAVCIPPATTVQAAIYLHFVQQPQTKSDQ